MASTQCLIVGAGPTGMSAAIELRRAGLDVRVLDKSTHMALHSQALVVQARTLEQFDRYGIANEAVAQGRKLTGARLWSEGRNIAHFEFARLQTNFPFALFLPQSQTEALLNRHMESLGVKTERGTELLAFTQQDNTVQAILRHPDGVEEEVKARWLLGCDGAHSAVREIAGIPFEGKGIPLSFFLGDLVLEGSSAPGEELAIHLHHGDVVFLGRLDDRFVRVIVAAHDQQGAQQKQEVTLADFQTAFDRAGLRLRAVASDWMTPFRVNDRQAKQYRAGNVFLAGDASHIHSPVGGQGMNTGIQDVANLAWKIAAVERGAPPALLESYQEERGAVGEALLRFTERGLKLATTDNRLLEEVRDTLLPMLTSLKPVQRAATSFISELAISYRGSSIVSDSGGDGDLHAGDRMPDLHLGGTTLLANWHDARHLAILLGATAEQHEELTKALPRARVLSVASSDLDDYGHASLGRESKLLIVRPDGYLGFRGPMREREAWQAYIRQDALG